MQPNFNPDEARALWLGLALLLGGGLLVYLVVAA